MALGAQQRDVLGLVMRQGLKLVLAGLTLGLVGSLLVTQLLASMLFAVSPTDLPTFAVVSLVLAAVALLGCCIPAWRAAKVDPIVSLRYE
jgi:putative ABC transport system permease protein